MTPFFAASPFFTSFVALFIVAVGPKFGNAFHNFLDNQIVENDAISFSTNIAIFNSLFPDWFRVNPGPPAGFPMGLNHLDTDVALAFPSLDLTRHPDFNGFTANFASSEATFLKQFFLALDKMSKLGVTVDLKAATPCIPCGDIMFEGEFCCSNLAYPFSISFLSPPRLLTQIFVFIPLSTS
jgi:hypothetical protein